MQIRPNKFFWQYANSPFSYWATITTAVLNIPIHFCFLFSCLPFILFSRLNSNRLLSNNIILFARILAEHLRADLGKQILSLFTDRARTLGLGYSIMPRWCCFTFSFHHFQCRFFRNFAPLRTSFLTLLWQSRLWVIISHRTQIAAFCIIISKLKAHFYTRAKQNKHWTLVSVLVVIYYLLHFLTFSS